MQLIDIYMDIFLPVGSNSNIVLIRKSLKIRAGATRMSSPVSLSSLLCLGELVFPLSATRKKRSFKSCTYTFTLCRSEVNLRFFSAAHAQSLTSRCVSAPHV